jgi:hypothetical protein
MNPIAIWSEIQGYGDWCYKYRIPTVEEFTEGFKYDFRELTITVPGKDHVSERIKVFWKEYVTGNNKDHKHVEKFLQQYLEAGYIRVMKANEGIKQNSESMEKQNFEYFLFYLDGINIINNHIDPKPFITGVHKERPVSKLVVLKSDKITSVKEAEDYIYSKLYVKDFSDKSDNEHIQRSQKAISIRGVNNYYRLTSSGVQTQDCIYHLNSQDQLFILSDIHYKEYSDYENILIENKILIDFDKLPLHIEDSDLYKKQHPTNRVPVKNQQGEELTIIGADSEMHPVYQEVEVIESRIPRKLKKLFRKAERKILSMMKEDPFKKKKGPAFKIWKSIEYRKPKTTQPAKSENRLVWIANIKTEDIKRIPWIEADKLVKESGYQFMSKVEAKSLSKLYFRNSKGETVKKVKIGKSFTPALGDNGIYVERAKQQPSKSSSKTPIHKKKHNGIPRNSSKTALKTYEVTIEKYISDNSGTKEYVYTISAPTLAKAINRGKLRILETHKDIEFYRNHGELLLAHFWAHGKEIIENGTLIPEKKNNSTKGFLRPIIVKLITPLTKTIWNKDTGKPEKMDVDEITKWVREFDKKEVSKKVKDWKHPIKNIRK